MPPVAALRFPHSRVLLPRTRLAYIHLRNLLTDAKRDRAARISGYVAVSLPEELVILYLLGGEVVNATVRDGKGCRALGIAAALALTGYTGAPFTLFGVMALMLVLGVGVNYAIFLVEGRGREGPAFVAVLLSAATTVLSFGLLAFSGTPALAQFGRTLVAGIGVAVLPTYCAADDLRAGRLKPVLTDYTVPERPLYVVYPYGAMPPKKVRLFVDFIAAWFRVPPWEARPAEAEAKRRAPKVA